MSSSKFKLKTSFKTTPDQQSAINQLVAGIKNNLGAQVLLGVTGSGKTFTVANVIERVQRPALVISHNKTLAAQLYQEFKSFFPDNAVSYFVSYYDYYQPEAYIPSTDTYIEKDSDINELIDKLRLSATSNLLSRPDTLVVASVSSIYNLGSPQSYSRQVIRLTKNQSIQREDLMVRLIELQYERGDFGFHRGTFRALGQNIDIYLAYEDFGIRVQIDSGTVQTLQRIDPMTGITIHQDLQEVFIYPAKHFIAEGAQEVAFAAIKAELAAFEKKLLGEGKVLEAHRIRQKVTYDLEMLGQVGYVKGIENYSRYFDGRKPNDPPNTLLDYFTYANANNWLVFVDESHITFPQIKGMEAGDRSRKQTLIDYGFRLPSALDNRPLTFNEFLAKIPGFVAISATPSEWEKDKAKAAFNNAKNSSFARNGVAEQLLRPTGIPDPKVYIRPLDTQVKDVMEEVRKRVKLKQRTLITTLTKKTAEDLSSFMKEKGINVAYLHSDVKTLERTDILDDLRKGNYDCLVGVNLLREGLDLPEVSLVAILDADKEGFLRSEVSLIQTMGRAARHVEGTVVLYADRKTGSMDRALKEVARRRAFQIAMNKKYNITPTPITKPFREKLAEYDDPVMTDVNLPGMALEGLTPMDKKRLIRVLEKEMLVAAKELNFELAASLRDKIKEVTKS